MSNKVIAPFLISFILSFVSFYNLGSIYAKNKTPANDRKMEREIRKPSPTLSVPTPTPTIKIRKKGGEWIGKVSHYSYNGCLGCNPDRRMANGETLDDSRATIAFNWLPMNTRVLVINLDNGKSIEAIVTDTGGFNELGRIADLTPAVYGYLESKTNVTNIEVKEIL